MDDNNNKKNVNKPARISSGALNKNKKVVKKSFKVTKHFDPKPHSRGAIEELPHWGLSDDDNPQARVRTSSIKHTVRAITKPPRAFLSSSPSCSSKETKHQYTYKKISKRVSIERKINKISKTKPTSKDTTVAYVNDLRHEISEYKTSQISLRKAADELKDEIKEYRACLDVGTNTVPSTNQNTPNKYEASHNSETDDSVLTYTLPLAPCPENANEKKLEGESDKLTCSGVTNTPVGSSHQLTSRDRPPSIRSSSSISTTKLTYTREPKLVKFESDLLDDNYSFQSSKGSQVDFEQLKREIGVFKTKDKRSSLRENRSDVNLNGCTKVSKAVKSIKKKKMEMVQRKADEDMNFPIVSRSITSIATESSPETHKADSSYMEWSMKNDEYVTILQEQKKQIQVFSDVIQKAQQLVTLISRDTKMHLKPNPLETLKQLYNVSTQADLTDPNASKQPTKDAKENTVAPSSKNEQTTTVEPNKKAAVSKATEASSSNQNSRKDQETNTTKPNKKGLVSKATKPLSSSSDNKDKKETVRKKKLSTHLMSPVEITRELVTQKIPSINIDPQHTTAEQNEKLCKLIDIVKSLRGQEPSTSSRTSKFIPDDQKNYAIVDETVINDGGETPDLDNHIKILGTNMTDKIVQKLQDPEAQYMCKSYQVCDSPEKLDTFPEVDSSILSHIDDDVYETYVNPNGKKSQSDSKSSKSTVSANISKKSSNAEMTTAKQSSLSLSLKRDLGSKTYIHSILTRNRESLHDDQNKHFYFSDSDPGYAMRNKSNGKYEQKPYKPLDTISRTSASNKKSQKEFPVKIDSAVSVSIKDYLANPRARKSVERIFRDPDLDEMRSKVSRASDLSDSSEHLILSIDKVNIHRKSGFYGTEERNRSLFEPTEQSTRKPSSWGKVKNQSYDTIDEQRIISDMRIQTISTVDSGHSKSSKESATAYNTDEAIKIIHLNDSVEETTTYCSFCSKCCYGKKRRVVYDDAYAKTLNKNSVQFMCSRESLPCREINSLRGKIRTIEEMNNEIREKPHSLGQIKKIEEKGKQVAEPISLSEEAATSGDNHNDDRKRSVKIEEPSSKTKKESGLTGPNSRSVNTASPIHHSEEGRNLIEQNKTKLTVLGVSIDQTNISSTTERGGGGGDKSSYVSNSKECAEIVDLKENLSKIKVLTDEESDGFKKSDGEIMNISDCSIGEMHICAGYPENVFLRDLRKSHKKVVNRKVQNSNWISYYVSPVRARKVRVSVPINDSSDSVS